jgi:LAO/AO transport system kinase
LAAPDELERVARGVAAGDKAQIARALNLIEDKRYERGRDVSELLTLLARQASRAHGGPREHDLGLRVGLTGPPGVGKSTLVASLARELRGRGRTVGVVAVDPSSMRSGGALLGDRARMAFDPSDRGLFVRSLATQGALGGLAHATYAAVEVLAAAYDVVLVETVGVGQTEVAVTHVSDSVVLVVQPGSGDVLQFLKAGVMEIPDLLVVNKADHGPTASRAASDLKAALGTLRQVGAGEGDQPVILTSARDQTGIGELADAIARHAEALGPEGIQARRSRGQIEWAGEWLERQVGSLGIETLGGTARVRGELEAALTQGELPLARAQASVERLSIRVIP